MATTNTFNFPFDQFTDSGKALLAHVHKNPAVFGLSGLAITSGLVIAIVPIAFGFSATGPVAGSVAAAWQSAIGNVVAGSLFATLQSLTMTRQLLLVGGALVVVGAIGMAGAAEWAKGVDWARGVDWVKGADWTEWVKAAGLTGVIVEQWASSVHLAHAMSGAEWVGMEAWKRTEEGVRSVDWVGVMQGAEWAGREGWARTQEGVRAVDWEGVGQGIQQAFAQWRW